MSDDRAEDQQLDEKDCLGNTPRELLGQDLWYTHDDSALTGRIISGYVDSRGVMRVQIETIDGLVVGNLPLRVPEFVMRSLRKE